MGTRAALGDRATRADPAAPAHLVHERAHEVDEADLQFGELSRLVPVHHRLWGEQRHGEAPGAYTQDSAPPAWVSVFMETLNEQHPQDGRGAPGRCPACLDR